MDIQYQKRRGLRQHRTTDRGMHRLHPLVIFAYYGGTGLLCMVLFHPLFLGIALLMLLLQLAWIGAWAMLRQWLTSFVMIGAMIVIWNPLFSHRGDIVLFYLGSTPIVLESVLYGVTMMLLVFCILVLFLNYNALMSSLKFLYLFARAAPKLAVMTAMAVRFVPLLRRRLSEIAAVQRTRGISLSEGSLLRRMKHGILLLQIALVWSLEEAMHTADALAAKGFGSRKRSSYQPYRMDRNDVVVLTAMSITALCCLIGWLMGFGTLRMYPALDDRVLEHGMEYIQLMGLISYLAIPLMVEWKERRAWR